MWPPGQLGKAKLSAQTLSWAKARQSIHFLLQILSQIKISWLGSQIIGLEPMMVSEATPSPYLDAEIVTLHQLGFNWLA